MLLIRYFASENEKDFKEDGGELIAETNTHNVAIIPRKGDLVFIGNDPYRVFDVCYCNEFTDDDNIREVKLTMIDITMIEEKF